MSSFAKATEGQTSLLVEWLAKRSSKSEVWWRDPESNRGRKDFQSFALPTELPRQIYKFVSTYAQDIFLAFVVLVADHERAYESNGGPYGMLFEPLYFKPAGKGRK